MKRESIPFARPQLNLDLAEKIIVDLFAGGGGMSSAIEMAWGRSPDIAINHNDDALSMHRANHPETRHFIADVFEVDPISVVLGRLVGWLHGSPDCTHFSQAIGGQPRSKKIRGLAWVLYRWAGQVRPDVISLENVKQILKWGPLIAKRDKATGRVITLDLVPDPATGRMINRVANPGEQVPVQNQFLIPDPRREGQTWRAFVHALQSLGYVVETRIICAADFGGHTTRERLFMIARCDGKAIVWPEPTHAKVPTKDKKKWNAAADCIDWSIPCPSIFDRQRPLVDATMRRIAKGIQKYVLNSAEPFLIKYYGEKKAGEFRGTSIHEPIHTQSTENRFGLITPVMIQAGHGEGTPGRAQRWGDGAKSIESPVGTATASGGGHAIAVAHLLQANGGFNATIGRDLSEPVTTITNTGSQQQLVTAHLTTLRQHSIGVSMDGPVPVVAAGGEHHAVVQCTLSPEQEAGATRVAAFLMRYYGEGGQWSALEDPITTITTKDRMALVTVTIEGTPYVIVDIGFRMLEPRELYRAQDFPDSYQITHGHDGREFSKKDQVRMCGNSVDPLAAVGFLRANAPELSVRRLAA